MSLVPEAAVIARAGAEINPLIVRAGLELKTTIMKLTLVPTLTLKVAKGGSVQACFDARLEIRPLRAQVRVLLLPHRCAPFKLAGTFRACLA